ncbi:MAG: hypothetical protein M3P14_00850 [Chloroflexota bacterium]|nr:hypothetical protein [Chloroflexota bacterium]
MDDALDWLRLKLDTYPEGLYQPVPSLPVRAATRATGSESRWRAMLPVIEEASVRNAVDIGASVGFFSINFGSLGIPTIALEAAPEEYRTLLLAVRRSGLSKVGVLALQLTPDNVSMVPPADCTLCLSVWHHFVCLHGLEQATAMLKAIWTRTGKVMFFDTGEAEMPSWFGLPEMRPNARSWLTGYLAETCESSTVRHLGLHRAFDAQGNPCRRNLFGVIREVGAS